MVLANNHLKDYGDRGLTYTLQQLDQANISYIGAGVNQKMLITTLNSLLKISAMLFLTDTGTETLPISIIIFML